MQWELSILSQRRAVLRVKLLNETYTTTMYSKLGNNTIGGQGEQCTVAYNFLIRKMSMFAIYQKN